MIVQDGIPLRLGRFGDGIPSYLPQDVPVEESGSDTTSLTDITSGIQSITVSAANLINALTGKPATQVNLTAAQSAQAGSSNILLYGGLALAAVVGLAVFMHSRR